MPGLAVVGVDIGAMISLGTKQKGPTVHHLANGQNVPRIFRDNVDGYEINFGLAVRSPRFPLVATGRERVQASAHMGDGFHLDTPEVLPSLQDEVEGIDGAVGLGHHETETRRLVQKSYLTKVAALATYESALPSLFLGRGLLGRSNASGWSAPGSAHGLWKVVLGKKWPCLAAGTWIPRFARDDNWEKKRRKLGSLRQTLSLLLG